MLLKTIVIAGYRARSDVRFGANLRVAEICQVWNLRTLANDRLLYLHKVSGPRAILKVRAEAQPGKWTDHSVVIQAALYGDAMRFDKHVVP